MSNLNPLEDWKTSSTGKTMLAKAIAKESGAVFFNVRISNLMSKWLVMRKNSDYNCTAICFPCFSPFEFNSSRKTGRDVMQVKRTFLREVAAVFSLAYKLQPAIIFIDEVDSFLGQRRNTDHETMTNMKTEFMALWDGFTTDLNARVMVLAATNHPSELDEAILRCLPQVSRLEYLLQKTAIG
ncbi:Detected protein of confused Function [Hibiscus syriacus]|uniref:Detected protein of confused Function n=1 Tax=Hibiscus syriacus TaxID=106335 RepID=A0A6A3D0P5_HIBSY|nr:Detected protein of confused Function [Hibiscus syriacus]